MLKPIKTKSGSTALYIVVFASLLFTVITVGFVNLIISEVYLTNNDELSQSAYDSALAGIEDAKLAIVACNSTDPTTRDKCNRFLNTDISTVATDPGYPGNGGGCETVSSILDRTSTEWGTNVTEDSAGAKEETNQAYTCVTIKDDLPDYRSSLSYTDTDSVRIVPLISNHIDEANFIRLSWYANTDNNKLNFADLSADHKNPVFHSIDTAGLSEPPSLSVTLVQASTAFSVTSDEIDYTINNTYTDRGTLILVPSPDTGYELIGNVVTHHVIQGGVRVLGSTTSGFIKANDKTQTNEAYIVKCAPDVTAEFVCSVIIELPKPVGGTRNPNASLLAVSMLYGQPSTDFSVELCRDDACHNTINFNGAQYAIDSTGRAADVYNRVEHRVEVYDTYFPFAAYAMQLNNRGTDLYKVFWATNDNCVFSNNSEVGACSRTSGLFSDPNGRIQRGAY